MNLPTHHWTDTVAHIKVLISEKTKQNYNNCVINCYRTGKDFIGFHSDKMTDIKEDTFIVSVSFDTERTMVLINNERTHEQRFILPHGSMFVLGPKTNAKWKHSIETAPTIDEMRISLTYRKMKTWRSSDGTLFEQAD